MLVRYKDHIICYIYLPNKEKIIQIKKLRIIKSVDRKVHSYITFYDAIIVSKDYNTSNTTKLTLYSSLQSKPYYKILSNPISCSLSNI